MRFQLTKQDKINKIIEAITVNATDGGGEPRYKKLDNQKLAEFLLEILERMTEPNGAQKTRTDVCSSCGCLKTYKGGQGYNGACECFCHKKGGDSK